MKVLQIGDFIEVKKSVKSLTLNYYYLVGGIYKKTMSKSSDMDYLNQISRCYRYETNSDKYLTLCMNDCYYYVQLVAVLTDDSRMEELNINYLRMALNIALSTKLNFSDSDTEVFSEKNRLKLSNVESVRIIRNVADYDTYMAKTKLLDAHFCNFVNEYLMTPLDVVNYFTSAYYNRFLDLKTSLSTVYKGYVYVRYVNEDALIQTCVENNFTDFSFLTLKRVKKEDVKEELLKLLKLTLQHDSDKILKEYGRNYKIKIMKTDDLHGLLSTSLLLEDNVIESLLKRRKK